MRISPIQQKSIKQEVAKLFGPQAVVRLFGSRVDDAKKGGDIDLLIELDNKPDNLVTKELRLNAALIRAIGDQKIDILFVYPGFKTAAVHEQAMKTGVIL